MCNFNKQSEDTKALIHLFMKKAAKSVGGENFLLALIESLKSKKPNALMYKGCQVASNNTIMKWNKIVFKDKVDILQEILQSQRNAEKPDFNILNNENTKTRKNILNMVRTLAPLEFIISPQNPNDGPGFDFKVFESIEENCVKINPIFLAMFFCSIEFTKKALRYEI